MDLRGPRCRVVDQGGDLRELDARRDAVEGRDALGKLGSEECPRRLLGLPEIDVPCPPVLSSMVNAFCRSPGIPAKVPFALSAIPRMRLRSKLLSYSNVTNTAIMASSSWNT